MTAIRLLGFTGETPRVLPRLLPAAAARSAFNTRLEDGSLDPIRLAKLEHVLPELAPGESYKTIYLHNDQWLAWKSVVSVAPGPVAADRLYVTGDGVPKIIVAGVTYPLALGFPGNALIATVGGTATSDLIATRTYVYTWVTEFGEESEPSSPSPEIDWKPGQSVTLSGFQTPPAGRAITTQRIYRSQSGTAAAGLFLIAERPASDANYVDTIPLEGTLGYLPSAAYNAPPDDLHSLIALPNGMMAAASGKDLYFCEPFIPHAWPVAYSLTCDYPIVALGAFGNTVVVLTTGNPYIVTGNAPETMAMEKQELNLPCVNARGVVDLGYAIAYPSHQGLVVASASGVSVASERLFTKRQWEQLDPFNYLAGQYNGRYFLAYNYIDANEDQQRGFIIIDLSGNTPFLFRSSAAVDSFYYDLQGGGLYYADQNNIFEWDSPESIRALLYWRSGEMVQAKPTNFGAIYIETEDDQTTEDLERAEQIAAEIRAANAAKIASMQLESTFNGFAFNGQAFNSDALQRVPDGPGDITVLIYSDGVLVASVGDVNEMARLPGGFLTRRLEVAVVSERKVTQISLATTGAELMMV